MYAILTILLAAGLAMGWGALWYGLLGEHWMPAVGLTRESIAAKASETQFAYGVATASAVACAIGMRWLFARLGVAGALDALFTGLTIGLFAAAPWTATHYAFADRPKDLWWIDIGHTLGALALIGFVLGLMA